MCTLMPRLYACMVTAINWPGAWTCKDIQLQTSNLSISFVPEAWLIESLVTFRKGVLVKKVCYSPIVSWQMAQRCPCSKASELFHQRTLCVIWMRLWHWSVRRKSSKEPYFVHLITGCHRNLLLQESGKGWRPFTLWPWNWTFPILTKACQN